MEVNTAATAASKALPPTLKISAPASVASLEPVEMMLLFKIGNNNNYGFMVRLDEMCVKISFV